MLFMLNITGSNVHKEGTTQAVGSECAVIDGKDLSSSTSVFLENPNTHTEITAGGQAGLN